MVVESDSPRAARPGSAPRLSDGGGPQGRVWHIDSFLLASSWICSKVGLEGGSVVATRSCWLPSEIGAILRPISPPGYTACGPPRSNLTDPRDRDTLHFDFTAGGKRAREVWCLGELRLASRRSRPCGLSQRLVSCARYSPGCGAVGFMLVRALVTWWVSLCTRFLFCGRRQAVRLPQAPVSLPTPARVSRAAVVSCEGGAALDAGGFPGAQPSVCRGGLRVALRW